MNYVIFILLGFLLGLQIKILMKKQKPIFIKQDDIFYGYTILNNHKYIVISFEPSTNDVGYFNVDNYNVDEAIKEFKKRKNDAKSISGKV